MKRKFEFNNITFMISVCDGIFYYKDDRWTKGWYDSLIKILNSQIENWGVFQYNNSKEVGMWIVVACINEEYFYKKGSFGNRSDNDELLSIKTINEAIEFLSNIKNLTLIGKNKEESILYLKNEKNKLDINSEKLKDLINKVKNF